MNDVMREVEYKRLIKQFCETCSETCRLHGIQIEDFYFKDKVISSKRDGVNIINKSTHKYQGALSEGFVQWGRCDLYKQSYERTTK